MSSVRSWSSLGGDKDPVRPASGGDIVKMGYLKKLKTMKKKYFVLRGDSSEAAARLEYYDSEKKFKSNHVPKRSITLKTCFNINKRSDTRQKWVTALYTKNDCFCLVMETEEELEDWLKMLLTLQHGEDVPDGEEPKPIFEHVWQVTVQKKELGHSKNILGPYLLCLTDRTLSLVKMDPDSDKQDTIEFSLQSIRRCGDLESFFYMEVGQMSVTGAGNLWMQTEDNIIAQNMHAAILSACRNCKDSGLMRLRSYSTNESSRSSMPRSIQHDGHPRWPGHTGLTDPRRRSDSLSSTTSRARTISETSPMPHLHRNIYLQPSLTRPQFMYSRTTSYSPPVIDSSPVSPESRGFSTDSAGSSLSMEGEGMEIGDVSWEGGVDKYGHSLTPDEPVILEENVDGCEDVQWPPDDDYVAPDTICLAINNHHSSKTLPNPNNSGFKSSSPSQNSLADVCSPCGSSPLESSAYMTMSPGEKPNVTSSGFVGLGAGCTAGSVSVNHSRGSSLNEDGYVHMAPMLHDDGYVDMTDMSSRSHRHNSDHFRSGELSPASSCSITSGTPSTDIRFSEYTLEKVSTFITPSEDEITPNERPARAYSVGSRPTFKKRNDIVNQSDCQQRVRAFSVGSRCPRVHLAHLTPPPRHPLSSSHSSVEPSEDLMELDFTRNNKSRSRNHSKKPSSSERLSVPPSSVASSAASSYSTAEGSYMEMSPRSSPKPSDSEMDNSQFCPSPPKNNRMSNFIGRSPPKSYMDMKPNFCSSSPPVSGLSSVPLYKVPEGDSNYVEMTSNDSGGLLPSSSPSGLLYSFQDGGRHSPDDDPYLEMQPAKSVIAKTCAPRVDSFPVSETSKPQNILTSSLAPPIKSALVSTPTIQKARASQEDYLDMDMKRRLSLVEDNNNKIVIGRTNPIDTPKKPPDGYVEMTVGNPKPSRKPSLDNFKSGEFDYMNMTGSGKKERKGSRKDHNNMSRYSSQPIAIQSTISKEQSSSTSPVFTFVGRKHSTGTPPKVPSYLPLGNFSTSPSSSPYSSLGRRTRKTPSRRESKELSSSGSSTPIFPLSLNSPSSPMKPLGSTNSKDNDSYESAAKCPVDARSGTVRLCYSPTENPILSQPQQQQTSGNIVPEQNDYINFNPLIPEVKETNDYSLMKPVNPLEPSRKISAPPILSNMKSRSIDKITFGVSNLTVSSPEIHSVPNSNNNNNNDKVNNNNTSDNSDCNETVICTHNVVRNVSDISNVEATPSKILCSHNINNCNSNSEVMCAYKSERVISSDGASDVSVTPVIKASLSTSANFSSVPTTSSSSLDLSSPTVASTSAAVVSTDSVGRPEALAVNTSAAAIISVVSNSGASAVNTSASATTIMTDKELHYASLDLPRSDSTEENSNGTNFTGSRSLRNQSSSSSSSTPSPNPNISQNSAPTLTYAEIDFSKSSCSNNANSPVH